MSAAGSAVGATFVAVSLSTLPCSPDKLSMNSEIIRYRMLLLYAVLGYPIWGLLLQKLEPTNLDPLWARLLIAAGVLLCLIFSYRVKNKLEFLETVTVIGGWVMALHFTVIAYLSDLSNSLFCSYLILLTCLLNVFPTKRSTWMLATFSVVSGAILSTVLNDRQVSALLVNVSLLTTVTVSLGANLTRINQLRALTDAQDKMNLVFQNMKDGLIVLASKGQVTMANPSACQIFGLCAEQLMGTTLSEIIFLNERNRLVSPEDLPFVQAQMRNEDVRDCSIGYQKPDGGLVWLKMTAVPMGSQVNDEFSPVLLTISDMTDVKRSQLVGVERQARKEATAKLTALGEMAAGVAHEINNPLAIILGKVYTIEKFLQTGKSIEPLETSLAKISQTVDRIKKIIQGLQAFATGGEQDPFQSTDLALLVREVTSKLEKDLGEKKIQILLDLELNLNFDCRPNQISQCLTNLIRNSCDAIEQRDDRWIRIWTRSAHQSLVLTITDSGVGIPEEIQSRLMEPFFTTKPPGSGTGLGLSITRGLISSHTGRIWLDSSAPHTTFVVELPLTQVPQKKAA
jgi:PAS domain S-box-containing protein